MVTFVKDCRFGERSFSLTGLKGGAMYGEGNSNEGLRSYVAAVVKAAAGAYDAAVAAKAPISEFWPIAKDLARHQDHTIATQLLRRGYDGLIFTVGNRSIAGHVFFQRKNGVLHMFNVYVEKSLRGSGLCYDFLREFVKHARKNRDITHVRIGAGGHQGVVAVSEKFAATADLLKIAPEPESTFGGKHYFRILR